MYLENITDEQIHGIKQDLLEAMASRYIPTIRILQGSNGFDDGVRELLNGDLSGRGIERHIVKMLCKDIYGVDAYDGYFRKKDIEMHEKLGIITDTKRTYMELRKEYLDLIEEGGLKAFMIGLGQNSIYDPSTKRNHKTPTKDDPISSYLLETFGERLGNLSYFIKLSIN